jgi:hypothetical protein
VKLTDRDGDEPNLMRLVLRRNGAFLQELEMKLASSVSTKEGRIYHTGLRLPPGSFEYRFRARDDDGPATGTPVAYHRGPLGIGGAPVIMGMAALPTNGGVQVTFGLAAPAQVHARVLNMAGRPVRTICQGRECEAGTNVLLWNAQNDQGLPVPSGTYLVEVVASTPDGSQAKGLTQVRVNR